MNKYIITMTNKRIRCHNEPLDYGREGEPTPLLLMRRGRAALFPSKILARWALRDTLDQLNRPVDQVPGSWHEGADFTIWPCVRRRVGVRAMQTATVGLLLLALCGCQSTRQTQNLADAKAGTQGIILVAQKIQADASANASLHAALVPILALAQGTGSYIDAALVGETVPPPSRTPEAIAADAPGYAAAGGQSLAAAKAEKAAGGWWSAILTPLGVVGAGLVAILASRFLPGPAGTIVANLAWSVLAPTKVQAAEAVRDEQAAATRAAEDRIHTLERQQAQLLELQRLERRHWNLGLRPLTPQDVGVISMAGGECPAQSCSPIPTAPISPPDTPAPL